MTDKEWKELCDWAETNKFKVVNVGSRSSIYIYINEYHRFVIYDSGAIFKEFNDVGANMEIFITKSRTPQQIKSIIENLL